MTPRGNEHLLPPADAHKPLFPAEEYPLRRRKRGPVLPRQFRTLDVSLEGRGCGEGAYASMSIPPIL